MTTYPAERMPAFFLESKHADIQAFRNGDFHYAWKLGENQLLSVEYIPMNWPCLTVSLADKATEEMIGTLEEIGFEVNKDYKS